MIVTPRPWTARREEPAVYKSKPPWARASRSSTAPVLSTSRAPLPAGQDLQRPSGRSLGLLRLLGARGIKAQPRARGGRKDRGHQDQPRFEVLRKFDLLEERFKEGEPSLVECDALSINGDVRFERDVVIAGR